MAKDTVETILDLIRAAAPELPADKLDTIARKIHQDLGGGAHYFPKAPAQGKAFRLGEQVAAGVPLAQAFASVGVSESYGYRLLSRTWRFRS
jgi:hypothetical protein